MAPAPLPRPARASIIRLSQVSRKGRLPRPTANTLVQTIIPDELRGRVMSAYMFVFFASAPFGSLLMGSLAQALGPAAGVAIGAGVALAFSLVVVVAVLRLRRLES